MKKCPKCKLINPDEAQICDCGYNFEEKVNSFEKQILNMNEIQLRLKKNELIRNLISDFAFIVLGIFLLLIYYSVINNVNSSRFGLIVSYAVSFTGIGFIIIGYRMFKKTFSKYKDINKIIKK